MAGPLKKDFLLRLPLEREERERERGRERERESVCKRESVCIWERIKRA